MLGRVRASPINSLQFLEVERNSSKIIKHDSLSIYESTLLKLKQGSHLNQSSTLEDISMADALGATGTDAPEEEMTDADCSSTDSPANSCDICPSANLKMNQNVNISIRYMFSRYKSSKQAENSINKELIVGGGVPSLPLDALCSQ